MQTYHIWIGVGFTTHDVILKPSTNGCTVSGRFTIACHHERRGRDETMFMACLAFGETAELLSHTAPTGSLVLVQGRLRIEDMAADDTGTVNQQILCIVSQAIVLRSAPTPKLESPVADLDDISPTDDGDLGPQVQVNVHPKPQPAADPRPAKRYRTNF